MAVVLRTARKVAAGDREKERQEARARSGLHDVIKVTSEGSRNPVKQ